MIAHELAHIKNHDTLLMTITATIAGAISMVAQFGMFFGGNRDNNHGPGIIGSIAMMILAPLGAMLVQMAISRTREYAADDLGARICGQPMWLASALSKIANAAHQVPNPEAERNPATAHMFIINPLSGHGVDNLFTTHPSTENRIAALQQLAAEMGARGGTPSVNTRGNYPRRSPWGGPRPRADRGAEPLGQGCPLQGHSHFVMAGLKREARLRAGCPGHPRLSWAIAVGSMRYSVADGALTARRDRRQRDGRCIFVIRHP